MPLPAAPTTKSDGDTITAALWNANNSLWYTALANYVVFKDVGSQVVTKTLTFTPDASYGIDITTGGARIQAGGLTITAGGLTVTAGNVAVTAGNLTFAAASAKIIPGATSLLFRDNGDANTNLSITDAGAVTVRAGLTVSAGTTAMQAATCTTLVASSTVTGSGFTASGTTPKLLIGSTNMTIRDDNDAVTLATFTDSVVTIGNGVSIGAVTVGQSIGAAAYTGGNVELGNTGATTGATSQFVCIDSCAGVPSGAPSPTANMIPMRYDRTNNRIYFYNGSWRYATLT